jgi:putative transposase
VVDVQTRVLLPSRLATKAELVAAVDKWMEFYNNKRSHSVIGMLSPVAYAQSLNAAPQAA